MEQKCKRGSRPSGLFAVRRRAAGDSGVAVAEFALVLPILMLLVVGMLDFGKAINYWIDQQHLANEAARWAAVNASPVSSSSCTSYSTTPPCQYIAQATEAQADTAELRGRIDVCVRFPSGSTGLAGQAVEVVVSSQYGLISFLSNQLGVGPRTLRTTATMRIERPFKNNGTDAYQNQTGACP